MYRGPIATLSDDNHDNAICYLVISNCESASTTPLVAIA